MKIDLIHSVSVMASTPSASAAPSKRMSGFLQAFQSNLSITVVKAACSLLCVLSLSVSQAHAAMQTYGFYKLTNNNVEDLSSQLSITIWDAAMGNSTFGLSGTADELALDQILFTVQNDVGIASNIAEVYFHDGLLGPSETINSLGGFTNYDGGGAAPGNLPSGNTALPPFVATTLFSADVNPGPPGNGVNTSDDILGIVLGLGSFLDFNAIVNAVDTGALRFGYHVRSIGSAGGSDSYVNSSAVPVPAAAWLFASALGALGVIRRRVS